MYATAATPRQMQAYPPTAHRHELTHSLKSSLHTHPHTHAHTYTHKQTNTRCTALTHPTVLHPTGAFTGDDSPAFLQQNSHLSSNRKRDQMRTDACTSHSQSYLPPWSRHQGAVPSTRPSPVAIAIRTCAHVHIQTHTQHRHTKRERERERERESICAHIHPYMYMRAYLEGVIDDSTESDREPNLVSVRRHREGIVHLLGHGYTHTYTCTCTYT